MSVFDCEDGKVRVDRRGKTISREKSRRVFLREEVVRKGPVRRKKKKSAVGVLGQ